MLIIHGTVHTMDGPAIDNGFVAIREGKDVYKRQRPH